MDRYPVFFDNCHWFVANIIVGLNMNGKYMIHCNSDENVQVFLSMVCFQQAMRLREVQPTHPAVEPTPDYHLTHVYRYNLQLVSLKFAP